MYRRIFASLLSTVTLSFILAYLMSAPIYHFLTITGIAYLLGGIPVSIYIDKYIKSVKIKWLVYLISGFIVGIITIIVFSLFINGGTITLSVFIFGLHGAIGSLIFLFYLLITNKMR